MSIFLERIDSAPLANTNFDMQYMQWVGNLIDTLNEVISDTQNAFNLLEASDYTDTQIAALQADGELADGVILYDSVNQVYVGRQGGALVQFTTAAYP